MLHCYGASLYWLGFIVCIGFMLHCFTSVYFAPCSVLIIEFCTTPPPARTYVLVPVYTLKALGTCDFMLPENLQEGYMAQ